MGRMLSFRPFRVAKRRWEGQQPTHHARRDPEKLFVEHENDWDDTDSSNPSSRSTSDSYQHLLKNKDSSRPARSYFADDPFQRASRRKKCNLYFTASLTSILVLLVLALIRAHYYSSQAIESYEAPHKKPAWEEFSFLKRYHGGIRSLVNSTDNKPEYPKDVLEALESMEAAAVSDQDKNNDLEPQQEKIENHRIPPSKVFKPLTRMHEGQLEAEECYIDPGHSIRVPNLRAYDGVVSGFPNPVMGSHLLIGLRNDLCFDRFGRLGPYGLGYSERKGGTGSSMEGDRDGATEVWEDVPQVDFRNMNWSAATTNCLERNEHRFGANEILSKHQSQPAESDTTIRRSVVVIRTWHDYEYDPEDVLYLRSLMNELSLASGMEYTVHFLIHVRDETLQIWSDQDIYDKVLTEALPAEFRGMGTLWSEQQMSVIYGGIEKTIYRDIPVHSNYRSTFMPLQHFAHKHLEYEYFWNWEMDTRYTGHYYDLLTHASKWARVQPRKGLWERNARFYIPSQHGSWEDFRQMVRVQTEHGTSSNNNIWAPLHHSPDGTRHSEGYAEKPIWGPERPEDNDVNISDDPVPPTTYTKDDYEWGVGEEADLITFNPLFDPDGTDWLLAEDVTGYNLTSGLPPRRASIITNTRLSRRLLNSMHIETSKYKHTMFSEMWPGSVALHHGLKAVYVPHPTYIDRNWPTDYLAAIFNGGRNGASGGARTSVFSDDRQHNFLGMSWYYRAGAPANLWKRWLGYKVNNDGGEEWEMANEGRMCLPPMLLHPVKQVDLVIE